MTARIDRFRPAHPRFAVAVLYEGSGQMMDHELYIIHALDGLHAEGIALSHATADKRKLISLLVTPASAMILEGVRD